MRKKITTTCEVVGLGSISVGAFMLSTPLGFIVFGAFAVAVGYIRGGDA